MTETVQYAEEHTTRASERFTDALPAAYDEKDNMDLLRQKLAARKKPIYAGLAFLCVVVIGVSIAVSSGGETKSATTGSGVTTTPAPTISAPVPAPVVQEDTPAGGVHAADLPVPASNSSSSSRSSAGSIAGDFDAGVQQNSTTPMPSNSSSPSPPPPPSPSPDEPALPFKALDFDWTDASNWEYADFSSVPGSMVSKDGIKLTPDNSKTPIRTKTGWGGEKIVLVEWERSSTSDTNIWMLNTKIKKQFGDTAAWPYYGELDIFEMFAQDDIENKQKGKAWEFSANGGMGGVSSYGEMTMHYGKYENRCQCEAAYSKSVFYENTRPMVGSCSAQFPNDEKNAIATVWGRDKKGFYIQLIQHPKISKSTNKNGVTFDVAPGTGVVTKKIYNNDEYFWGVKPGSPCVSTAGYNPNSGFPYFEDFRLVLEEQKKNDGSAWFKVTNIQIFVKA